MIFFAFQPVTVPRRLMRFNSAIFLLPKQSLSAFLNKGTIPKREHRPRLGFEGKTYSGCLQNEANTRQGLDIAYLIISLTLQQANSLDAQLPSRVLLRSGRQHLSRIRPIGNRCDRHLLQPILLQLECLQYLHHPIFDQRGWSLGRWAGLHEGRCSPHSKLREKQSV